MIGAFLVLLMAITGLLLNHRSWIGYGSETELKLQKFVFGIHSGMLGNMSILWLTDLGAICMIVLSLTGLWMSFKGSFLKIGSKRRKENER
jgi:hypothetical protein